MTATEVERRRALIASELSLADESDLVVDQIHELAGDPVIGSAVGGIFPNNFSLVLIRPDDTPEAYAELIMTATQSLNFADEQLLEACERYAVTLPSGSETARLAHRHVGMWRTGLEANANLIGSLYAIRLFDVLGSAGRELLDADPQLVENFHEIPAVLRELVRVNCFLPTELVRPTLRSIIERARDAGCADAIDRIEVAKRLEPAPDGTVPPYPMLMLYGGLRAGRGDRADLLAPLASIVVEVVDDLAIDPRPDDPLGTYAHPLAANVNITQGYRLYKKYLELLGALDDVFTPASGHALVRRDRAAEPRVTDAVADIISDANQA